jgi:hypothetical protein
MMVNSPGASQQVGHHNQQTVIHADRVNVEAALAAFLKSPDFVNLPADKQQSLKDMAEVVGATVAAPARDVGKIKRWGARFLELARDFGVEVAAAGVSKALFG